MEEKGKTQQIVDNRKKEETKKRIGTKYLQITLHF